MGQAKSRYRAVVQGVLEGSESMRLLTREDEAETGSDEDGGDDEDDDEDDDEED